MTASRAKSPPVYPTRTAAVNGIAINAASAPSLVSSVTPYPINASAKLARYFGSNGGHAFQYDAAFQKVFSLVVSGKYVGFQDIPGYLGIYTVHHKVKPLAQEK